jgi:hypothetical protein
LFNSYGINIINLPFLALTRFLFRILTYHFNSESLDFAIDKLSPFFIIIIKSKPLATLSQLLKILSSKDLTSDFIVNPSLITALIKRLSESDDDNAYPSSSCLIVLIATGINLTLYFATIFLKSFIAISPLLKLFILKT